MIHLTAADYRAQPWANGRGTTVELLRGDGPGGLLWRLSMADVVEDGPFSMFPGVERSLTVIEGPGFDLAGGVTLRCDPLVPVAFPGDVAVHASGVTTPCRDFNVMTARSLPPARVEVLRGGAVAPPDGGFVAVFALEAAMVGRIALARHDLIIARDAVSIAGGPMIVVGIAA